ncbi:hypothetical protein D3C72_1393540 [compost metagenome]
MHIAMPSFVIFMSSTCIMNDVRFASSCIRRLQSGTPAAIPIQRSTFRIAMQCYTTAVVAPLLFRATRKVNRLTSILLAFLASKVMKAPTVMPMMVN